MLDASCPRCGAPLPEMIPAHERARYAADPPDRVVRAVKCRAPGCGRNYAITAGAYQRAKREARVVMAA